MSRASRERLRVQKDFFEGINEIFTLMFTESVQLFMLDNDNTNVNVYRETGSKVYLEPISLVSNLKTTFKQGEGVIEGIEIDALFTVPAKQVLMNEIPCETLDDLEFLRQAKMKYGEIEYLVHKVIPKTLVADAWQFYDFACLVDKNVSIKR